MLIELFYEPKEALEMIERYHRTIKGDCIRVTALWTIDDARKAVSYGLSTSTKSREIHELLHKDVGKPKPYVSRPQRGTRGSR